MPADPIQALNEGPAEDTPKTQVETEAPVEDTPVTPAVNFEQRYNSLRPEFDRTKQQLAEERALREQYEEALRNARQGTPSEQPGYDGYDEDDYADPVARRELAEMRQWREERERQDAERARQDALAAQQEEKYTHIDNELEAIEREFNEQFDEDEANWIGRFAESNLDEDGNPDVRLGYQKFVEMLERRKQKWVDSKPTGGKPPTGPGAVEVPDLDDPDEVERLLNEAFEAHFNG